jgi:hypothetical protein
MVPYQSRAALKNLRAGVAKMEAKLTVADKVYREFRAGRPIKRDRLLKPFEALGEGVRMRDRLQEMMAKAGLPVTDCRVALVFQLRAQDMPQVRVIREGAEIEIYEAMLGPMIPGKDARLGAVTVGFLFAIRDRESTDPERAGRRWAHPLLTSPDALSLLKGALDSQEGKALMQ